MSHSHQDCCQAHEDQHHHEHDHNPINGVARWILSLLIISSVLIILRSFLITQMWVRVVSYSSYGRDHDVIRIARKILILDSHNQQAWTALGFVYMDQGNLDKAIEAFAAVSSFNFKEWQAVYFELGRAYFLKKEYTKAVEYFEWIRRTPRADVALDAAILKYRHGTLGFQSVRSMGRLLAMLSECYKQIGHDVKAHEIQKEYEIYNQTHKKIIF